MGEVSVCQEGLFADEKLNNKSLFFAPVKDAGPINTHTGRRFTRAARSPSPSLFSQLKRELKTTTTMKRQGLKIKGPRAYLTLFCIETLPESLNISIFVSLRVTHRFSNPS